MKSSKVTTGILPSSTFQLCAILGLCSLKKIRFFTSSLSNSTGNKVHFNPAHCIAALLRAATAALYRQANALVSRVRGGQRGEMAAGFIKVLTVQMTGQRDARAASGAAILQRASLRCQALTGRTEDELLRGLYRDGLLTETSLSWCWWEMCLCFSPSNLRPCIRVLCGAF